MDNIEMSKYLQILEKHHAKNFKDDKKYVEGCKANKDLTPRDYKIDYDHKLSEYFDKYGNKLLKGKLFAFKKNELWLMNKDVTYWKLDNDSDFVYFSLPYINKKPIWISLVSFFVAGAIASGVTAGVLLSKGSGNAEDITPTGKVTLTAGEGKELEYFGGTEKTFEVTQNTTWGDFFVKTIKAAGAIKDSSEFLGWTLDGSYIQEDYQLTLDTDITLIPKFASMPSDNSALIFTALTGSVTININLSFNNAANMYEYSTNGGTSWTKSVANNPGTGACNNVVDLNEGDRLFIRSCNENFTSVYQGVTLFDFEGDGKVALSGSLAALNKLSNRGKKNVCDSTIMFMFAAGEGSIGKQTCENLISARNFDADIDVITNGNAPHHIFKGCVNLLYPPKSINYGSIEKNSSEADYTGVNVLICYFQDCKSLKYPPKITLPSSLVSGGMLKDGLSGIFNGCESLKISTKGDEDHLIITGPSYIGITEGVDKPVPFDGCTLLDGATKYMERNVNYYWVE